MKKIKKVVLFKPHNEIPRGSLKRLLTPLGLLYIAAVLEKEDYDVSIIDSQCEGYDTEQNVGEDYIRYGLTDEQIIERIKKENPDFVGVNCPFSEQMHIIFNVCKLIKKAKPDVFLALGGIHPSFFPKQTLEKCPEADFIILGEGEYRLRDLLNAINNNTDYTNQDGIAFRKDRKIFVNEAKYMINNLDELPFPARHLVDMEKYISVNIGLSPYPRKDRVEQILTSRGCPFHCRFCSSGAFWKHNFRQRSVDNVIEEMKLLKEKYKIEEIQFTDDNMSINREFVKDLCQKMKKFNFVWCTPTGIMMKTLDEEIIKLMAESGCYQLTFAIESANQRVLDSIIHKPLDLKIVKPLVDAAHKYGIGIHTNNIISMPGERKEEMLRTFEFNREIGADSAAFFLPMPLPGSDLYKQCQERGWLDETEEKIDFKHVAVHIKKTDPEYVMSKKELEELVDRKTREHNEWSKKNNPKAWEEKFSHFLKKHPELREEIMGRVT